MSDILSFTSTLLNVGSASRTVLGYRFWSLLQKDAVVTTVDIDPDSKPDIIADAANLPLDDCIFDLVVCQACVEHIYDLNQSIIEIKRVTKKDEFLYFTAPFLQGFHADPSDYRRFTLNGFVDFVGSECVLME